MSGTSGVLPFPRNKTDFSSINEPSENKCIHDAEILPVSEVREPKLYEALPQEKVGCGTKQETKTEEVLRAGEYRMDNVNYYSDVQDALEPVPETVLKFAEVKVPVISSPNLTGDENKTVNSENAEKVIDSKQSDKAASEKISKDCLELPSEVRDRKFLVMPRVEKVVDDDDEWNRCGKWIWSNHGSPEILDQVWIKLQPLLSDGTLILIKASTPMLVDEPGGILCYTKPEKEAIKRAAKAIRAVIDDDHVISYKVNLFPDILNKYEREHVPKYMCTAKGRFYGRDHLYRWILDEDSEPENQLSCMSITEEKNLGQLLSNARDDELDLKHPAFFQRWGSTGRWTMMCDNSAVDENGWTETDRVWAAATMLFEKHAFERIACTGTPKIRYISCYVTSISNIITLTESIWKVMKNSQYANPVYFYTFYGRYRGGKWTYRLSAEGELYELKWKKSFRFQKFVLQHI